MDRIVDSHIMIVLIELLVHYYDTSGNKVGSFDTYCNYITNYLNGNVKTLPKSQIHLFDYLVQQLERQYGLPKDPCLDQITELFTHGYWKNVYQNQHESNRFLYV
jgi:hypothetical protein